MTQGRIIKALSGFYYVDTPDGIVTCRGSGKLRHEKLSPLVGDEVSIRLSGDGGGTVVCTGTPETVADCAGSYTGQYLKRSLEAAKAPRPED